MRTHTYTLQTWSLKDAHDEPLSMVRLFDVAGASGGGGGSGGSSSASLIASGDEGGGLKIWDARAKKQVFDTRGMLKKEERYALSGGCPPSGAYRHGTNPVAYILHTDYISDAALHERERALVVSSGDGTLSVHDLRAGAYKFRARRLVFCMLQKSWRDGTSSVHDLRAGAYKFRARRAGAYKFQACRLVLCMLQKSWRDGIVSVHDLRAGAYKFRARSALDENGSNIGASHGHDIEAAMAKREMNKFFDLKLQARHFTGSLCKLV
eukprot:1136510-Pelagomonas_calceolata.AAC.2